MGKDVWICRCFHHVVRGTKLAETVKTAAVLIGDSLETVPVADCHESEADAIRSQMAAISAEQKTLAERSQRLMARFVQIGKEAAK